MRGYLRHVLTLCVIGLLAGSGAGVATATPATADIPPEVIRALRDYRVESGALAPLLQSVVPRLAPVAMAMSDGNTITRGGPLAQVLHADQLKTSLDASPGSLPIVIYKQEEGRMPGAWIIARYRRVRPAQVLAQISDVRAALRHPLVDQHLEVSALQKRAGSQWGEGAVEHEGTSLLAVHMPFGAGMFGLRDSYVVGQTESVMLPNGVAMLRFRNRPARPEERTRFRQFQDKKGHSVTLDDSHFEASEYVLTSLLIPERDGSGAEHTVHVYFTRIVPALKPGTQIGGDKSSWVFQRGARDSLVIPVKLIRDEVERQTK